MNMRCCCILVTVIALVLLFWSLKPGFLYAWNNTANNAGNDTVLQLSKAENMALERHPSLEQLRASIKSSRKKEVYTGQWEDPKFSAGLSNAPVDTFDLEQEPMTQVKLGVEQEIPFPGKLSLKQKLQDKKTQVYRWQLQDLKARLLKEVRLAWLERLYQKRALQVVSNNLELFDELISVAETQYAVGDGLQQDVLLARLERDRLLDERMRLQNARQRSNSRLAELTKQMDVKGFNIPEDLPRFELPSSLAAVSKSLTEHPLIKVQAQKVGQKQAGVDLAEKDYYPDFGVQISYGHRRYKDPSGEQAADFVSGSVKIDLPVFTENRQDKRVASALEDKRASRKKMDTVLLELKQRARSNWWDLQKLKNRITLFEGTIVPESRQTVRANMAAYTNGRLDFLDVVRARIRHFNSKLKLCRLRIDAVKSRVNLVYLAKGGNSK